MRIGSRRPHCSWVIASCSSIAAEAAADGRSKTENVASPSPRVLISRPPRDVTTCSTSSSCRASATAIASASASQAAVDPSMSVSRKVTARITDGSCCSTTTSSEASCATMAASSRRSSGPGSTPNSSASMRPCPLISAKSVTLPAGAVEGEHQLAPSPFAQRRLGHRRLELADDLRGAARREQCVGPILHERGVALDPPRLFRCSPPTVGQLGDTAPEGQRLLEAGHRLADVAGRRRHRVRVGPPIYNATHQPRSRRGPNPSPASQQSRRPGRGAARRCGFAGLWPRCVADPHPRAIRRGCRPSTTEPWCSPSIVRMARGLAPGIATGAPSCRTCRGPKTPSSTA